MLKTTMLKKIFVIVFGICILGFFTVATAADKEVHHIYSGTNKIVITIVDGEVIGEPVCTAPNATASAPKCFSGNVKDLKIVDTKGDDDASNDVASTILENGVPDGITIRTLGHGTNPGCTWYFWFGKWWEICD